MIWRGYFFLEPSILFTVPPQLYRFSIIIPLVQHYIHHGKGLLSSIVPGNYHSLDLEGFVVNETTDTILSRACFVLRLSMDLQPLRKHS